MADYISAICLPPARVSGEQAGGNQRRLVGCRGGNAVGVMQGEVTVDQPVEIRQMLCRGVQVVVEALHQAFVDAAGAAVDDRRQPATAQALIGVGQPADRLLGQWLGAVKVMGHEGRQLAGLAEQQLGGRCLQAVGNMSIHGPFTQRVGQGGPVEPALFMVGNKVMMRDYIDQQVAGVAQCNGLIGGLRAGQHLPGQVPIVAGTERRGFHPARQQREVWQTGSGHHQAGKCGRRPPERRVAQRDSCQGQLGKPGVGVQPPGECRLGKQHER